MPTEEERGDRKEEGHAWEAFEWWYGTRAYPNELLPKAAYFDAYRYARENLMPAGSRDAMTQWTSIGPDNVEGARPFRGDRSDHYRIESILDYIEIPLLVRLSFGKKIRVFMNAGPYIGFLVRAKALTEGRSFLYMDKDRGHTGHYSSWHPAAGDRLDRRYRYQG